MNKEVKRCCERVFSSGTMHSRQCAHTAKINRGGRDYCTLHDPVRVEAAAEARRAAWAREWDDANKQGRLEGAAEDMLAALREARAWAQNEPPSRNLPWERAVQTAIVKATGQCCERDYDRDGNCDLHPKEVGL
jgi:hypothetical protein